MPKSLMARALYLLSRREYTRQELNQRLTPFSETPEQLHALLDELTQNSWQSDQRFAQEFVDSKGKCYGIKFLQQAMHQRGISANLIRDVLKNRDDLSIAQNQWQKQFGKLPITRKEHSRQIRFLARRGFTLSVISQVIRAATGEGRLPNDD